MDLGKSTKNIQANLDFLKRFQGKKSIITKSGLISSTQEIPLSYKVQRKDGGKYLNKIQSPKKDLQLRKTKTQASCQNLSTPVKQFKQNLEAKSRSLLKTPICLKKNKKEFQNKSFQQSIQNNSFIKSRIPHSMELPKIKQSLSNRKYNNNCSFSPQKIRHHSFISSHGKVLLDASSSSFLEELEDFEKSLRKLKIKNKSSNKK